MPIRTNLSAFEELWGRVLLDVVTFLICHTDIKYYMIWYNNINVYIWCVYIKYINNIKYIKYNCSDPCHFSQGRLPRAQLWPWLLWNTKNLTRWIWTPLLEVSGIYWHSGFSAYLTEAEASCTILIFCA